MVREIILMILIAVLGVTVYQGMWYSATVVALAMLAIALDHVLYIRRYEVLGWYCFLFCVAVLTLIFNYYLTSRPVVLYFDDVKSSLMILTIPVEDFIFGISLVSMCVSIYEKQMDTVRNIRINNKIW